MHSHSWHWQLKEGITIDGKDIYRFIIALLFIFPVRSYINHLVIEPQINSTFPFDAELESWLYFQNHLIIIGGVLLLLGWFTRIIALLIGLFTVLHLLLIDDIPISGSDRQSHRNKYITFQRIGFISYFRAGKIFD